MTIREKQKYQVTNVGVKSEIVTFLLVNVQLNLTQFITRSNLACSDANNDRIFFSVLIFHETNQINIDIKTKKTL